MEKGGIEEALKTENGKVNWTFLTEVALMADVVIGDLIGRTAALEAHLVGAEVVLIDELHMYSDPFILVVKTGSYSTVHESVSKQSGVNTWIWRL